MANRKIGAVIALDGEQQFKSAVTACTRELNTMKSALKLVEAQTDGQAKSLETLQKKHSALNDVLEATRKKEEAVSSGLEHAKSDYDKIGKEVEEYQKQLKEAQEKLDKLKASGDATDEELKEQQGIVEKLAKTVEQGEKAYDKAGDRIQDWEKKLNDAKTETVKAEQAVDDIEDEMRELEKATDNTADELDDYAKEARDADKATGELDISMKSMLKNSAVNLAVDAMRAIGDKAIEAGKYIIEVGSEFESSISRVSAISGATGGDLAALTEKAKEMGSTTKFSASESASAFEYMAMAGWKTEEMLQGIDGVMALAAASGEDLATTSDIVTDALTAFGEEAGEAGRLADIMAAASSNANTNVSMMGETFKYAVPVAGALGISMEDTAVAVGLMANAGVKASQAGTALRTGLTNLAKPTKQMQDAMDKYNVALVENEDGSVNLRETMIQLREKIGSLSETEQAAATAAIFGKDSMAGWMAVINASDEDFDKLTTAIDNSNGAAQGMSDTMQNNLSGSLTIFKSALEGLGIELYNKAVEPLTGAVDFATKVISGLTNLLKDSKTENEIVLDQIKEANKSLSASVDNASTIQKGAEETAGQISVLTEALINLNSQENLDETQKKRLKGIYDQLVELVPELAGHYNEETGKIDLTTEAVKKLTQARKNEIIEQGRLKALADIYEQMGAAQAELQKAVANVEGMKKQRDMWETLRNRIGEAQSQLNNTFQDMNKGPDLSALEGLKDELLNIAQAALNSGAITKDTYDEIAKMFDDNWSESELAAAYETLQRNVEETDIDIKNAEESMGDLQREYDNAELTVKNLEESINNHTKATREEIGVVDDSANSINAMTDEKLALKKATDDVTESTHNSGKKTREEIGIIDDSANSVNALADEKKELKKVTDESTEATEDETDAIAEATKAVHDHADAQKTMRDVANDARDQMAKAYEDIKKSAENAFNLNPFDQWQQDVENGWMAFDGAMLSQIEGMKNYRDNMDLIREHLSEKAPDFVQFLEDMGQSGAQFVDDLARGIREGGEESMASIDYSVGLWRENHSMEEAIEDSMVRNKLAMDEGFMSLSESAIQAWDELGYAFDEGVAVLQVKGSEMTQETSDAFWAAVEAAKAAGMEVPKGAAEAIRNSEDPELATQEITSQIDAGLRAQAEVLFNTANELGLNVPEGAAQAIRNGATGQELYSAYEELRNSVKNQAPNMEAAGTEIGEAASGGTATGITDKTSDVTGAADSVVNAAKDSASTATTNFRIVGNSAMEALKLGIGEKSQEVADRLNAVLTIAKNQATNHANNLFPALGEDIDLHIIAGMNNRMEDVKTASAGVSNAASSEMQDYTKFRDAGISATNAYGDGIYSRLSYATDKAGGIAGDATGKFVRTNDAWYAGYNTSVGLGNGIYAGQSHAVNAAINVAQSALDNARGVLGIYSPSRKFHEIGDYTIQGFVEGLEDGQSDVEKAINDTFGVDPAVADTLTDFDLASGTIGFDTRSGGMTDKMDVLIELVGRYMPEILTATEADKQLSMGDDFMPVIANKTSEIIGRNTRRLM